MGEAAIQAARAAGYYNAGTVEFLVDRDRRFYFLEMNTRLQVEHPVTELVTGLDLVQLQVEIAAGGRLPFTQEDIAWRGSAIECRIYAEDPYNNFLPSPGKLTRLTRPLGPGIRLDGCVYDGWTVPMDTIRCSPNWPSGPTTREHATARMLRALREYDVGGIRTNLGFFRQILEDPEFRAGNLHTGFIDEFFARTTRPHPPPNGVQAVPPWRPPASRLAGNGMRLPITGRVSAARAWSRPDADRPAAMKLDLINSTAQDSSSNAVELPPCRCRFADRRIRRAMSKRPSPASTPCSIDGRSYEARSGRDTRRRLGRRHRRPPLRDRSARPPPLDRGMPPRRQAPMASSSLRRCPAK